MEEEKSKGNLPYPIETVTRTTNMGTLISSILLGIMSIFYFTLAGR